MKRIILIACLWLGGCNTQEAVVVNTECAGLLTRRETEVLIQTLQAGRNDGVTEFQALSTIQETCNSRDAQCASCVAALVAFVY